MEYLLIADLANALLQLLGYCPVISKVVTFYTKYSKRVLSVDDILLVSVASSDATRFMLDGSPHVAKCTNEMWRHFRPQVTQPSASAITSARCPPY